MKNLLLITTLVTTFIGCGNKSADTDSPKPQAPPVQGDRTPDSQPQGSLDIDPADMGKLPALKPTTYYIAREENINCKGKYRGKFYTGREITKLKDMDDNILASVCTRFYKTLLMEGTAVLRDRGIGEITLNYAGKKDSIYRFREMDKCIFGEGVEKDLCLIPFHTLAADRKAYNVGDVVFIPKAVDIKLPDGSYHNGFFLVRDTGDAFNGKGRERVDMFTGFQPDHQNVFLDAGFHRGNPMKAYLIKGNSAKIIEDRMKLKFPDIY